MPESILLTSSNESAAHVAAEEWLRTLPKEVRINTLTTQTIKEHWLTNSPRQLAIAFVDAVQQRVWLQVAYMPAVESKRTVRSYSPLEWMRECIGAEPDELMRTVAGHLPSAEEGSAAAVSLIRLMRDEDPETLRELCKDYRHGESNMPGWNKLFGMLQDVDGVWGEAQAELQEAVKGKPGRPTKGEGENPAQCAGNNPTNGASWKPKDRKSRLVRTLANLEANPDECKKRGTTPEKVAVAKSRLVRGLTPSVEAAKREAGIAASTKPAGGLGVRGAADDVAERLIRMVGADHAKRIASAILEALKNG
tara:strand:- start:2022 stop:2945 length:924 start_codon:yes stop_codon:yes gene_type:complete